MHVGVGADPGVAEEVPGSADGVARLEDGVARPGALGLQVVAGADPREPRTHDEDVEVWRRCLELGGVGVGGVGVGGVGGE